MLRTDFLRGVQSSISVVSYNMQERRHLCKAPLAMICEVAQKIWHALCYGVGKNPTPELIPWLLYTQLLYKVMIAIVPESNVTSLCIPFADTRVSNFSPICTCQLIAACAYVWRFTLFPSVLRYHFFVLLVYPAQC